MRKGSGAASGVCAGSTGVCFSWLRFLVDSVSICLALAKGRSYSPYLIRACQRLAAHTLLTGCRIVVRWIAIDSTLPTNRRGGSSLDRTDRPSNCLHPLRLTTVHSRGPGRPPHVGAAAAAAAPPVRRRPAAARVPVQAEGDELISPDEATLETMSPVGVAAGEDGSREGHAEQQAAPKASLLGRQCAVRAGGRSRLIHRARGCDEPSRQHTSKAAGQTVGADNSCGSCDQAGAARCGPHRQIHAGGGRHGTGLSRAVGCAGAPQDCTGHGTGLWSTASRTFTSGWHRSAWKP